MVRNNRIDRMRVGYRRSIAGLTEFLIRNWRMVRTSLSSDRASYPVYRVAGSEPNPDAVRAKGIVTLWTQRTTFDEACGRSLHARFKIAEASL